LWAASEPALPKPAIAIGLAAITDLETYGRADGSCPKAVAQLLGGSSQENAWLYESLSPSKRIFTSPVVMIQGLTDSIVPAIKPVPCLMRHTAILKAPIILI